MPKKTEAAEVYRALDSALLPGPDMRQIHRGEPYSASDPAVRAYPHLFQPMSEFVEQTTRAPGELRPVHIPPASAERGIQPEGDNVPHVHPPEHPDSPASTFAPFQPAAGVVADDAAEKGQNVAGGPAASDATDQYKDETLDTSGGHTGEAAPVGVLDEPVDQGTDATKATKASKSSK